MYRETGIPIYFIFLFKYISPQHLFCQAFRNSELGLSHNDFFVNIENRDFKILKIAHSLTRQRKKSKHLILNLFALKLQQKCNHFLWKLDRALSSLLNWPRNSATQQSSPYSPIWEFLYLKWKIFFPLCVFSLHIKVSHSFPPLYTHQVVIRGNQAGDDDFPLASDLVSPPPLPPPHSFQVLWSAWDGVAEICVPTVWVFHVTVAVCHHLFLDPVPTMTVCLFGGVHP